MAERVEKVDKWELDLNKPFTDRDTVSDDVIEDELAQLNQFTGE